MTRGIAAVREVMQANLLFIADGHHRYETALDRDYRLAEYGGGESGHNPRFAMMTLVGMSHPGLVVLLTAGCCSTCRTGRFPAGRGSRAVLHGQRRG